jgi:hypothetical protein
MIKAEIFQGELVDPAPEIAYRDQFMHVKGILHIATSMIGFKPI